MKVRTFIARVLKTRSGKAFFMFAFLQVSFLLLALIHYHRIANEISMGDISLLASFVSKMKRTNDPLAVYLNSQFSPTTKQALSNYPIINPNPQVVEAELAQDLSKIIGKRSIFEEQRFSGVKLRPITRQILSQNPELISFSLARLNRLLLEDAYPNEIYRNDGLLARFVRWAQSTKIFPWITQILFKRGMDHAQTAFLLISVYLLITWNTYVFSKECNHQLGWIHTPEISKLAESDQRFAETRLDRAENYVKISIGLSVALALSVMATFFVVFETYFNYYWTTILVANEFFGVVLFLFFLLADIGLLRLCRHALSSCGELSEVKNEEWKKRHIRFQKMVQFYVFAVDAPGLIGMALIFVIGLLIHPTVAGFYWQGFTAGAIGLHLVFSQAALTLLATFEKELTE